MLLFYTGSVSTSPAASPQKWETNTHVQQREAAIQPQSLGQRPSTVVAQVIALETMRQ